MRYAVAVTALLLVVTAVWVTASSARSDSGRVSIAVTTVAVNDTRGTRSDVLLLWNRNQRSRPIGHGTLACVKGGAGGLLGGGVMTCTLALALPLGKVVASGLVHSVHRYTLVITGGTGQYLNSQGPLYVRAVSGDGVHRLVFDA